VNVGKNSIHKIEKIRPHLLLNILPAAFSNIGIMQPKSLLDEREDKT